MGCASAVVITATGGERVRFAFGGEMFTGTGSVVMCSRFGSEEGRAGSGITDAGIDCGADAGIAAGGAVAAVAAVVDTVGTAALSSSSAYEGKSGSGCGGSFNEATCTFECSML